MFVIFIDRKKKKKGKDRNKRKGILMLRFFT